MPSFRSRWVPFLGFAFAGCAAPAQDLRHLLWPDQLHLTYETGENTLEGARDWDVEREAVLIGLSWDISSRNQGLSAEDLRTLILELRNEAAPAPPAPVVASAHEAIPEVDAAEAAAPVEPPPEPEPEVVVAEEPPPEPVLEEPVPEVVAEVVPEVLPPEPPPVEAPPVVEEIPVEIPVVQQVVAQVEPTPAPEPPAAPAPVVEPEGRALFGVVLVSALGVLGLALAIRFLPGLRTARTG